MSHDHHHDNELDPMAARVRALETILVSKGLVDPAAIDVIVETYETKIGPRNGARVVSSEASETSLVSTRQLSSNDGWRAGENPRSVQLSDSSKPSVFGS